MAGAQQFGVHHLTGVSMLGVVQAVHVTLLRSQRQFLPCHEAAAGSARSLAGKTWNAQQLGVQHLTSKSSPMAAKLSPATWSASASRSTPSTCGQPRAAAPMASMPYRQE